MTGLNSSNGLGVFGAGSAFSSIELDEELAQVDVATLADAEQPRLTSRRILPWHDSQPRSRVAELSGPIVSR